MPDHIHQQSHTYPKQGVEITVQLSQLTQIQLSAHEIANYTETNQSR